MLQSKLETNTQNEIIVDMMRECNRESLSELVNYLTNIDPLNPRILNEVLRLSPDGSMLSFLSIFTDMRTIKQMHCRKARDQTKLVAKT